MSKWVCVLLVKGLERVGATGRVTSSDVSGALLEQELEVVDRCTFLECAAEDLGQIPDGHSGRGNDALGLDLRLR